MELVLASSSELESVPASSLELALASPIAE